MAARAVISGILVGLLAANVWPILLLKLGMPGAGIAEAIFLAAYIWWTSGGGQPSAWKASRAACFRAFSLSRAQWTWSLVSAVCFAATIHAAIVALFRLVPFPAQAFHAGYDFSFIPGRQMQRVAIVLSAASAGICEEIGFRGYMQRPIEERHGTLAAILTSSLLFTLLHLSKGWSTPGMVPIVLGAGLLLGALAWAAQSLIPCIIGHTLMDIGLFAYWWTQIAGVFSQRPVFETGLDRWFFIDCAVLGVALTGVLTGIVNLRRRSGGRPHAA